MSLQAQSESAPDDIELINDPQRITAFLQAASDQRAPVTVMMDSGQIPATSVALGVDTERGWLELDQPPDVEKPPDGEFEVRLCVEGAPLRFRTRAHPRGGWHVVWPTALEHHQRRRDFRARVARFLGATIAIDDAIGDLRDLSAGGVRFDIRIPRVPKVGECWHKCMITITDEGSLKCDIEIRRVEELSNGSIRIGARFIAPQPAATRWVRRWVMELERDQCRRATATGRGWSER